MIIDTTRCERCIYWERIKPKTFNPYGKGYNGICHYLGRRGDLSLRYTKDCDEFDPIIPRYIEFMRKKLWEIKNRSEMKFFKKNYTAHYPNYK